MRITIIEEVSSACRTAVTRRHSKVLAEDVTYALNQQQFDFERSTPTPEYYTILARVCLDKDIAKDERSRKGDRILSRISRTSGKKLAMFKGQLLLSQCLDSC